MNLSLVVHDACGYVRLDFLFSKVLHCWHFYEYIDDENVLTTALLEMLLSIHFYN